MWICRLLHTTLSSTKLAAVSIEKNKLQSFVANLISSGKFTRLSDIIPFDELATFDVASYMHNLSSISNENSTFDSFGQTVLVADTLPTTMKLLDDCNLSPNGAVIIAREQTAGRGRGNNQWTSPLGSALFTIHFDINLHTLLGQRLSLLQLLASVAVVQAIERTEDYKSLNVQIKWPNDIFIGRDFSKLGGILATSSISGNVASIKLGIGLNVYNGQPSVCLNDAIDQQQTTHTQLTRFTVEELISRTVGFFQKWIAELSQPNVLGATVAMQNFYQLYESLWMHQNKDVFVDLWQEIVKIVGIDEYGFLKVKKSSNQEILTLQADAHSFDVRQSIIREKAI